MNKFLHPASIGSLTFLGAVLIACGPENELVSVGGMGGNGTVAANASDPCAPQNIVSASEHPLATCAHYTDQMVPDLAIVPTAAGAAPSGGVGAQGIGGDLDLLDAAGDAAAVVQPSCNGKAGPGLDTCGVAGVQSCCSTTAVPSGVPDGFAVDAFTLDQFEVTSGRFEQFVLATDGNLRAAAAAGNWPGWKPEWSAQLPTSRAEVDSQLGAECKARSAIDDHGALTWPWQAMQDRVNFYMSDDNERAADIRADATPARLHKKPINCVSYYVATAFCAWDGGRLPSNAEWSYAAYGGKEQRKFPWGEGIAKENAAYDLEAPTFANGNNFTFPEDFSIYDNGMNAYHIAPPGMKPAGRARWGNDDMGGNLVEWTADLNGGTGTVRGGSWEGHAMDSGGAFGGYPLDRTYGSLGMRCAYGAAPVAVQVEAGAGAVTPVRRAYRADTQRFMQGFDADMVVDGYALQGTAFEVASAASADPATRELHRCAVGVDLFLSNDALCEGQTHLGALGFTYEKQVKGTIPLFRCYGGTGTHLSTVTPEECAAAGLHVEGTQGFVVPPAPGEYVRHMYVAGLGREPEDAGFQSWLGGFRRNGCSADTLADFSIAALTSPEFEALGLDATARVTRLYQSILERAPEPAGLQSSLDALNAGTSWAQLVTGTAHSPEATALAPKRCEIEAAANQDSCNAKADGWYCSAVDTNAAYQCANGAHAAGDFCGGGQHCVTENGVAKRNGDALACEH